MKSILAQLTEQKHRMGWVLLLVIVFTSTGCGGAAENLETTVRSVALAVEPTAEPATDTPATEPPATRAAVPTITSMPTATVTVPPAPSATATPQPTGTPVPTRTPQPTATNTSVPPTAIPPTAVPPTDVPPTAVPPTAIPPTVPPPTAVPAPVVEPTSEPPPEPTVPSRALTAVIAIINVNKQDEYVDLQNQGGADIDFSGWRLVSEKGNQVCWLGGVLPAGGTIRVWAMSSASGQGGFNCGFDTNIWNNSETDPAVLYDATGLEVARR